VYTGIIILVTLIIYFILKRYIKRLSKKEKIQESTAKNLIKLLKFVIFLVILGAILVNFVDAVAWFASIFAIIGGAVLGFASINTVGNAISGLIVMLTKPFVIGDYLIYNNRIARVDDIKLIYTKIIDLDGTKISIPNQRMLTNDIEDLGKTEQIRRQIVLTGDYSTDPSTIEMALVEAAKTVPRILKVPKPYVFITSFQNFAVEYKLHFFINNIKSVRFIEAELRLAILRAFQKHKIDLRTPNLNRTLF